MKNFFGAKFFNQQFLGAKIQKSRIFWRDFFYSQCIFVCAEKWHFSRSSGTTKYQFLAWKLKNHEYFAVKFLKLTFFGCEKINQVETVTKKMTKSTRLLLKF